MWDGPEGGRTNKNKAVFCDLQARDCYGARAWFKLSADEDDGKNRSPAVSCYVVSYIGEEVGACAHRASPLLFLLSFFLSGFSRWKESVGEREGRCGYDTTVFLSGKAYYKERPSKQKRH